MLPTVARRSVLFVLEANIRLDPAMLNAARVLPGRYRLPEPVAVPTVRPENTLLQVALPNVSLATLASTLQAACQCVLIVRSDAMEASLAWTLAPTAMSERAQGVPQEPLYARHVPLECTKASQAPAAVTNAPMESMLMPEARQSALCVLAVKLLPEQEQLSAKHAKPALTRREWDRRIVNRVPQGHSLEVWPHRSAPHAPVVLMQGMLALPRASLAQKAPTPRQVHRPALSARAELTPKASGLPAA